MDLDITEIPGFDNLAHPQGILKQAQERAARVFGAKDSWFLVNGSTSGVLTAINACFGRGDGILLSPASHLSVWRGIALAGGEPIPVFSEKGAKWFSANLIPGAEERGKRFDPFALPGAAEVESALQKHPGAKGMVLTAPTYEGAVPDVKAIADVLHGAGKLLVVDGAHGAHFGFHPALPPSATGQGADLVVHSVHKTLPALTQTALLHRCSERVDPGRIRRYVNTFQTSSPSYLLLASIDACVDFMEKPESKDCFSRLIRFRKQFDEETDGLSCLRIAGMEDFPGALAMDPGKVVICGMGGLCPAGADHAGFSPTASQFPRLSEKENDAALSKDNFCLGIRIAERLRKVHHIETELAAPGYCLALMSVCDGAEGWRRLKDAVWETDRFLAAQLRDAARENAVSADMEGDAENPLPGESAPGLRLPGPGTIADDYAAVYPPGIPFISPGEVWDAEKLACARHALALGLDIVGLFD